MWAWRWSRSQILESGLVLLGAVIFLLALDLYFQGDETRGTVIGEKRHEQFIVFSSGGQTVVHESKVVRYEVDGKAWTTTIKTNQAGRYFSLRYYRRWPGIVWTGNRLVAPLIVGLGATFCLGFAAVVDWVRRARKKSQM